MQDDITGKVFNYLRVLCKTGEVKNGHAVWRCSCERCREQGRFTIVDVRRDNLITGHVKSCGCIKSWKGENNPNWKGGRRMKKGYVYLLMPDHPNADGLGYYLKSRLVMEKHLGRLLDPEEVVHHINEDTMDNRIENLKLYADNLIHLSEHREKESKVVLTILNPD